MKLPNVERVSGIFSHCLDMQNLAITTKVKVGAVVEGINGRGEIGYFGGSNMETSISFTTHAEVIALQDCIMHRYYPIKIYVTSQSTDENVFLCGACRQQLHEINRRMEVVVFNPDGTVKGDKYLYSLLPDAKEVSEKNKMFSEKLK